MGGWKGESKMMMVMTLDHFPIHVTTIQYHHEIRRFNAHLHTKSRAYNDAPRGL
jgi:hypothetical protein